MTRTLSHPDLEWRHTASFPTLFTLVLWAICFTVGLIGFVFPYMRPQPPVAEPPPVQAELIKVELTATELPLEIIPPPANGPQPPAVQPLEFPKAPTMIAVTEPSPAVVFALPVEAPARIVDVKSASASRAVEQTTTAPSPAQIQSLTFGSGEGIQPAPEYPARARREGQEGIVLVRFTVGENGRVLSAEAASPSPWPLLNESAVRAVRERWRFAPGGLRLYEVAIRFEMRD